MARDYYALGVRINCAGFPMECVFHGFIEAPSVANEFLVANSIIEALDDGGPGVSWISKLQAILAADCYLSSLSCARIAPTGGNSSNAYFQTDDFPGVMDPPIAATQVAGCVIWNSTEASDKTGRNFIPGVSIAEVANGRFSAAYQTAVDAFIAKVLTGLAVSAGTFLWCFWNQTAKVGYQITGGYLSPKPGTQRRREVPL